ncbi:MAG: hypothetical protein AB2A00_12645 [Myxococcota bacterium]
MTAGQPLDDDVVPVLDEAVLDVWLDEDEDDEEEASADEPDDEVAPDEEVELDVEAAVLV